MRPLVVANWKMKLSPRESVALAQDVLRTLKTKAEVVLCPSHVSLLPVAETIAGTEFLLGAQDVFWEAHGAFTGEVSPNELKEAGCKFVIVGHSERRQNLGETDQMVHRKTESVLNSDMTPIICVGETFQQRQDNEHHHIIMSQVAVAINGLTLSSGQRLVVAYEPVWVIGTGQAIRPEQAAEMHQLIRQALFDTFPLGVVDKQIQIIYGGSVDSRNVADFTKLQYTNGVLVGTASLTADSFAHLAKNA